MNDSFWVFYFLDYIICIILSFLFINYFASKKVSKFTRFFSRIFIFTNCLLFFTLPYEIIYYNLRQEKIDEDKKQKSNVNISFFSNFSIFQDISNKTNKSKLEEDIEELRDVLEVNYEIIFWTLFIFENLLFIVVGYLESGGFTFLRKLWDSIKIYLIFNLAPYILACILALIYHNLEGAVYLIFGSLPIAYLIVFLAISIVKIPRRMYIHSDIKLALEYYEFRANKKLKELNKNEENLKKIYAKCQNTFDYIKKIEKYIDNNKNNIKENNLINENILVNENNYNNFNMVEKDYKEKEKKDE